MQIKIHVFTDRMTIYIFSLAKYPDHRIMEFLQAIMAISVYVGKHTFHDGLQKIKQAMSGNATYPYGTLSGGTRGCANIERGRRYVVKSGTKTHTNTAISSYLLPLLSGIEMQVMDMQQ